MYDALVERDVKLLKRFIEKPHLNTLMNKVYPNFLSREDVTEFIQDFSNSYFYPVIGEIVEALERDPIDKSIISETTMVDECCMSVLFFKFSKEVQDIILSTNKFRIEDSVEFGIPENLLSKYNVFAVKNIEPYKEEEEYSTDEEVFNIVEKEVITNVMMRTDDKYYGHYKDMNSKDKKELSFSFEFTGKLETLTDEYGEVINKELIIKRETKQITERYNKRVKKKRNNSKFDKLVIISKSISKKQVLRVEQEDLITKSLKTLENITDKRDLFINFMKLLGIDYDELDEKTKNDDLSKENKKAIITLILSLSAQEMIFRNNQTLELKDDEIYSRYYYYKNIRGGFTNHKTNSLSLQRNGFKTDTIIYKDIETIGIRDIPQCNKLSSRFKNIYREYYNEHKNENDNDFTNMSDFDEYE
jgi:hypothetical protein